VGTTPCDRRLLIVIRSIPEGAPTAPLLVVPVHLPVTPRQHYIKACPSLLFLAVTRVTCTFCPLSLHDIVIHGTHALSVCDSQARTSTDTSCLDPQGQTAATKPDCGSSSEYLSIEYSQEVF
jgi:hypothetical protein